MLYTVSTQKGSTFRRVGLTFSGVGLIVDSEEIGKERMSAILAEPMLTAILVEPTQTLSDLATQEAENIGQVHPIDEDEQDAPKEAADVPDSEAVTADSTQATKRGYQRR